MMIRTAAGQTLVGLSLLLTLALGAVPAAAQDVEMPPPCLIGDIDADRDVDLDDFLMFKNRFGQPAAPDGKGDFNGDGVVDLDDFILFKMNFGATGGPTFVDDFKPGWSSNHPHWRVASWVQNGTQMARERCVDNGEGFLVQTVLAGEPYRGGSMQSTAEYPYGTWQARLRPSPVPGVLNSMFTKDWDDMTTPESDSDGTGFEVDIEFLTYTFGPDTGKVHLAIHAPGHTNYFVRDVQLEFNPSDDFHVWGFDIHPEKVVWHVDGEVLATFNKPSWMTIPTNYEMFFNAWTKDVWIHGPAAQDAHYYIDWVAFTPLDL
ncbi:MAG: family 16 glycosylhydrolase [Planctomycetota bacterium]